MSSTKRAARSGVPELVADGTRIPGAGARFDLGTGMRSRVLAVAKPTNNPARPFQVSPKLRRQLPGGDRRS